MKSSCCFVVTRVFVASLVFLVGLTTLSGRGNAQEIQLSNEELKKLDTFEAHTLAKADQTFKKQQYRKARAQFDAFIARMFWSIDGAIVKSTLVRIGDKAYGKRELLSYYISGPGWNPRAALQLADDLVKVEKYATEVWWIKATLHEKLGKHAKPIAAYRNCQNEPTNLWCIARCEMALSKLESAVGQVREIENFIPPEGPKAAMHIAMRKSRRNTSRLSGTC